MRIRLLTASLVAMLSLAAVARADSWKDESSHGRGRGGPPPWARHGETPWWAQGQGYWDGHFKQGTPPGRPGYHPDYDQGWIGVPGLDRGYDRWRHDAERAYRRGDSYIQGWRQQPYPHPGPRRWGDPAAPDPYARPW